MLVMLTAFPRRTPKAVLHHIRMRAMKPPFAAGGNLHEFQASREFARSAQVSFDDESGTRMP